MAGQPERSFLTDHKLLIVLLFFLLLNTGLILFGFFYLLLNYQLMTVYSALSALL